ncbi:Holliday junction branch migration DNA helicase RuvB [candidate division KSB1 bacterium]|nr:Holliday junction branch migration DNA helicase RuvB [candidate division KSB1 bacterium]
MTENITKEKHRESTTSPERQLGELEFDLSLRPGRFSEFVGQKKMKENLSVFIEAAKARGESLDHVLFYGPPGLGKTTLAHIMAREMEVDIKLTSGPALEKAGDLAGILTNLNERDVFFIDEIHRLNPVVEEYMYSAMEDFRLDIVIDRGANARNLQLSLPHFTLVGATTRAGLLTSPLRDRFGVVNRLDYYPPDDLCLIVKRSAKILKVEMDEESAVEISRRARGTPRIANRLLRRIRDFAQIEGNGSITEEITQSSLERLDVDEKGLDEMDKRILTILIEKFDGGPVGINSLAVSVGEESDTIEEIYEPFLIKEGLLKRTSRGREVTALGYKHFGLDQGRSLQTSLF